MIYDQKAIRARAVDYSTQGFVITDPNQPDNPIVDVNDAFTTMTGYTRDDILGKNCRFMQGDETNQAGVAEIRQSIADRTSSTVLLRNFRKDGTMFWNQLCVSPVFDDNNALIYFIGIQQDVTEQQNLLQEIQKSNTDLKKLNAMMIDRELKMVELKKEIKQLKEGV